MRDLEWMILCLEIGCFLWGWLKGFSQSKIWRIPMIGLIGLLTLHLLLGQARWQMAPAYVLGVLLISWIWFRQARPTGTASRLRKTMALVLGIPTLAVALFLPWALPVRFLPAPTGDFAVGTKSYFFSDPNRTQLYANQDSSERELMVQIWYPCKPGSQAKAPYFPHVETARQVIAQKMRWQGWMTRYFRLLKTNAYSDALMQRESSPWPLLFYSHGLGNNRSEAVSRLQELASHGYVVAAIDHTYGCNYTVFPDGRSPRFVNLRKRDHALVDTDRIRSQRVARWVGDIQFVADALEKRWAGEAEFQMAIDFQNLGVLGFSNGGTVAGQLCWLDGRFKAGINLDGTPRGEGIHHELQKPFMFMTAGHDTYSEAQLASWGMTTSSFEAPIKLKRNRMDTLFNRSQSTTYWLDLPNARHSNFTDAPFLSPISQRLGIGGDIKANAFNKLVNSYVLAFFDKHLKQLESTLLEKPTLTPAWGTMRLKQSADSTFAKDHHL